MKPGICLEGADPELRQLGEATVGFLRELSESSAEDAACLVSALLSWRGPAEGMTAVDVASLNGVIAALQLRIGHGAGGEPMRPELLRFDTAGQRGH
jgi:hypothetical protein